MNGNDFRKQLNLLFTDIKEAIEESEAEFSLAVSDWQITISRGDSEVGIRAHRDPQLLILEYQQTRKFEFFDGQWLCVDTEKSLIAVLGEVLCELNGSELAVYL